MDSRALRIFKYHPNGIWKKHSGEFGNNFFHLLVLKTGKKNIQEAQTARSIILLTI